MKPRIVCVCVAFLFLTALLSQEVHAGHKNMKKLLAAGLIAKALKPRFIPLPIPIPFKLKIKKGEKIVPYPVKSYGGGGGYGGGMGGGYGMDMGGYGMDMGGYGGGMMGGGYGGGMMGGGYGGGMMGGMMGGYD
ncbi:H/ACA ribonucleoprotein complex subunit 1 [Parasteatoda tepidariorum]|uniref:H/ACA ribonucleoprotein complex subunit 1 n=1 Tax=Parasteatoda tepidariorum TaxID=114398 RepID=UPI00077FD078|nr:cold and drought-regulated protein CORA-like [Parasteatoda tepidariorum]